MLDDVQHDPGADHSEAGHQEREQNLNGDAETKNFFFDVLKNRRRLLFSYKYL